jgi:hypothetical protein
MRIAVATYSRAGSRVKGSARGRRRIRTMLKEYAKRWTKRTPAQRAAWAVRAIVIAVVPGALWIWLAWYFLRGLPPRRGRA